MKKIREYLIVFIVIAIIEFSIFLAGFWMLGDYEVKRFNVWPISEWLINYQGGFVRRGLVGELLHQLHLVNGIIPFLNKLVLGFFYCYIAIFLSVYIRSRIESKTVFIMALLVPGGIFHMAIGAIFYTRKEILFLIHFGILCLLYLNVRNTELNKKNFWISIFGLTAIIGGVVLTLIHEPYLFMAYPITLILMSIVLIENKKILLIKFFVPIYALLIPFVFLICTANHGDQRISQIIWDSYALSDRITLAPYAPYTSSYATGGLGWSFAQHVSTIYGVYISGTWIYWVSFLFGNSLIIVWIAFQLKNTETKNQLNLSNQNISVNEYVITVMFGYFISLLMLLIASDYGRWIACATNLIIMFAMTTRESSVFKNRTIQRKSKGTNCYWYVEKLMKKRYLFLILLAYELIFQMPECCIQSPDIFIRYDKFIKLF